MADLIGAAKGITNLLAKIETPSWLGDADCRADEVISCKNGLVHWPTRKLLPHRPGYYVHHSVPFAFDPAAAVPERWLNFLDELWPGDQDSVDALQETFGYLINGDCRQQKIFMLVGPKRGGKGTIGRVLTRMLGKHNVAGPTLASLGTNFGLQDLIGKPVALVSDARIGGKADVALIAERLLSISGQDLQNVDRKYLAAMVGLSAHALRDPDERAAALHGCVRGPGKPVRRFYADEELLWKREPDADGRALQRAAGDLQLGVGWSAKTSRASEVRAAGGQQGGDQARRSCQPCWRLHPGNVQARPDYSIERYRLYQTYRQWCLDYGRIAASDAVFGRDLRALRARNQG